MNNDKKSDVGSSSVGEVNQPIEQRWRWSYHQRERNAKVLKIAAACARQCNLLLKAIRSVNELGVTRILLCNRLISSLDAMCVLASFGFVTEARVVHRTMLDSASRLIALCKDPELFFEFLAQDPRDRIRGIDDLRSLRKLVPPDGTGPTDAQIDAVEAEAKAELAELERTVGRALKKKNDFEWAKAAGIEAVFWAHYALHSQAVHHSPRAIQCFESSASMPAIRMPTSTASPRRPTAGQSLSATSRSRTASHARTFRNHIPASGVSLRRATMIVSMHLTNLGARKQSWRRCANLA